MKRIFQFIAAFSIALGVALPAGFGIAPALAQSICFGVKGIGACFNPGRSARSRSVRQKPRRRTTSKRGRRTSKRSRARTSTRRVAVVRGDINVQRALNHFGYDVGKPDGLFGNKTRAGIKRYQTAQGSKATGTLTEAQKARLLGAWASAVGGGGGTVVAEGGSFFRRISEQDKNGRETADGQSRSGLRLGESAPKPEDMTPLARVNAFCEDSDAVARVWQATDGAERISDLVAAEFCTARRHLERVATTAFPELEDNVVQFREQCHAYGDETFGGMTDGDFVAGPDDVLAVLAATVPTDARDVADTLASTRACLTIAYADDDALRAQRFAAYAVALGYAGAGEFVAAHLALGIAGEPNYVLASEWYEHTNDALDNGGQGLIVGADYDHGPLLTLISDELDAAELPDTITRGSRGGFLLGRTDGTSQEASVPAALLAEAFAMGKQMGDVERVLGLSHNDIMAGCVDSMPTDLLGLKVCRIAFYAARAWQEAEGVDQALAALGEPFAIEALKARQPLPLVASR